MSNNGEGNKKEQQLREIHDQQAVVAHKLAPVFNKVGCDELLKLVDMYLSERYQQMMHVASMDEKIAGLHAETRGVAMFAQWVERTRSMILEHTGNRV